ncbi:hypothetical protein BMS3Bbin04_01297 [bacterium BMS3Bbin04]|nr:hypothetical protein BMS3Bbin04_01297 [bacterium BMS3Bbin04]
MKRICIISLIISSLLILTISSFAALDDRGPSLEQLGMAVSSIADPISASARVLNPAAGSRLIAWNYSASFSRSFNLPEFDRFQLAAAGPFGRSTVGGWASGFGRTLYSERSAGMNYSHPLYHELQGGVGLTYSQIQVKNYGSDFTVSGDFGLFWDDDRFTAGISVNNFPSLPMSKFADTTLPIGVQASGIIPVGQTVRVLAEIAYLENQDVAIRGGVEVWILPLLAIRMGYDSGTERVHLGLAIAWQGWTGQGAYDHHPWLGWSNAFGLQWYPALNRE